MGGSPLQLIYSENLSAKKMQTSHFCFDRLEFPEKLENYEGYYNPNSLGALIFGPSQNTWPVYQCFQSITDQILLYFFIVKKKIVLFVCPTWKRIYFTVFFFFFAHIRPPITKSTSFSFNAGNPWWRFCLWWNLSLQFSHLPT